MSDTVEPYVRVARPQDAQVIAQLLRDFNAEFDEPAPDPAWLGTRIAQLLDGEHFTVLLGEPGSYGVAVLRFRPGLWSEGLECYLAELYVVPQQRGHGLGRKLMQAAIEVARSQGADYMELGTAETDVAARALYESLGFDNHEGKPGGPVNYFYERQL
jgi:ribosomal protein S18 acetylase RimI-like enzyme